MRNPKTAVIGGGVSGLTAALALREAGQAVTVFEKSGRPGGAIQSHREEAWLCEAGPNTLQLSKPEVAAFLSSQALLKEALDANPEANKRFIVRNGRPHPVPASPWQGLTTRLWSAGGRLRVLKEPFIRPAPPEAEESLAQFVERRLGRELLDYAIDPFVAGVYAGRAEDLSVKYATRKIYNLEQRYGGLIKGAIKLARERKRAGTHFKTRLLSWPEGLETIPRRLAEALANDLHTDIAVTGIDRAAGGGWKLSWKKSGKRTELNAAPTGNSEDLIAEDIFDTVFLCLPAGGLLSLPFGSGVEDRGLESLEQIPYPPVANLCLGFRREQIKHPLNGFGFLVPSREGRRILGCLFSSTLFPGRAPEGHVLLTVFLGGARQPAEAANDLDALTATVLPELRELIGLSGEPVYRRHCFWPRAIPQYNVGFGEKLSAMNAFEAANPGLHILGQTRDGISLSYCLEAGLDAPNRLAARA